VRIELLTLTDSGPCHMTVLWHSHHSSRRGLFLPSPPFIPHNYSYPPHTCLVTDSSHRSGTLAYQQLSNFGSRTHTFPSPYPSFYTTLPVSQQFNPFENRTHDTLDLELVGSLFILAPRYLVVLKSEGYIRQ
jgi:hypothetical protein